MKLRIEPELANLIGQLKAQLPELLRKKAEARERVRHERQCTGMTAKGTRCLAWSVWGNLEIRCYRHGGAETALIPRSKRRPACVCAAYTFPHRTRSGLCNYPEEPLGEHPTPQGQRRYYKRSRKTKTKRWLKSIGL